jgi:anti-sigma factor RsiW
VKCDELQDLLDGYVDGELDLVRSLEIERHLQECSVCADGLKQHRGLQEALRDPLLYHRPPPGLEERIRSCLPPARRSRPAYRVLAWPALGIAASLAFVALMSWDLLRSRSLHSSEDLLAQEVVTSHVRSLMPGHLLDVTSSDQHTVKPWFNGRVDFSPVVKNLAEEGFPLVGGRLEYLDNKNVAALVYKRGQHVINLFIGPATTDDGGPARELMRQGFHLFHWTRDGLSYWVISDLNESELRQFVGLIQR